MFNTLKAHRTNWPASGWRDYQEHLKRCANRKRVSRTVIKIALFVLLFPVALCGVVKGPGKIAYLNICESLRALSLSTDKQDASNSEFTSGSPDKGRSGIVKEDVQAILGGRALLNLAEKRFEYTHNSRDFQINTWIDESLQHFILTKLDRKNSRYIGIVAMEPQSGKVFSMVGFDKINPSKNPCTSNKFPAASIFKIVTAAAAIEACGFDSDTKLTYNGDRYTLYKSQLREKITRYTQKTTFQESFALSINPVFGKIGSHHVEKSVLEKFAGTFGFNCDIPFEIPVPPSVVTLSDEPYHQAEIASGFNRKTLLSPLHAAMMTAAIVNSGQMIEPTIVDRIVNSEGKTVYESRPKPFQQVCSPEATHVLKDLMHATIHAGTCKKAFRDYRKDPTLSRLNIGGKSGSISNKVQDARFDWFVGYAEEKDGPVKMAISVVVAHEAYIGIRASQYARMIIKRHFDTYFASGTDTSDQLMLDS